MALATGLTHLPDRIDFPGTATAFAWSAPPWLRTSAARRQRDSQRLTAGKERWRVTGIELYRRKLIHESS
jgi:hypothetical protein